MKIGKVSEGANRNYAAIFVKVQIKPSKKLQH